MARIPRIQFPGAYYHLIGRGNNKQDIFPEEDDFRIFLNDVKRAHEQCGCVLLAYCLMNNHYHMLVNTPETNLPQFMHTINNSYSKKMCAKYDKKGHVFQSRYKSYIVGTDQYMRRVIRYIHQNPLKANMVSDASEWLFSSHARYLESKKKCGWLDEADGLSFFGGDVKDARELYGQFFREEIEDSVEDIHKNSNEYENIHKASIAEVRARNILKCVTGSFSINSEELFTACRNKINFPRLVCVKLLKDYAGLSYRRIAKIMGTTQTSVSGTLRRFKNMASNEPTQEELIEYLKLVIASGNESSEPFAQPNIPEAVVHAE